MRIVVDLHSVVNVTISVVFTRLQNGEHQLHKKSMLILMVTKLWSLITGWPYIGGQDNRSITTQAFASGVRKLENLS